MRQSNYNLGPNCTVDETAILGYPTGRGVTIAPTVIGENAQIRSNTVIYCSTTIGAYLETGHNVVIREENAIGNHFSIWNNSVVDYGCVIGNNVKFHNHIYVAQLTTIEDDVFLAPGVMIANDPHPICTLCMKGPTIRKGVRIGVNATILPLLEIGEYALIGSGSVVTKNIPPRSVAYGNPAQVVGLVDDLECPLGIVDRPYVNGVDVKTRGITLKPRD